VARILVVDDDSDIVELISMHLQRAGHQVLSAADGLAALHILAEREVPDLAVLDVTMPVMGGFTLAARLRELPECQALPIIFLTGRGEDRNVRAGLELGARYLTKPLMAGALLRFVALSLKEHPAAVGW
jgi:DNA-binding response OmpR family regulator